MSSEGSISHPKKSTGQFHSIKGSFVEGFGNITGQKQWVESGSREHADGEAEVNAAKLKGYTEGTKNRFGGWKDSVVGAISGNKSKQSSGNVRKEKGERKQEFNRD